MSRNQPRQSPCGCWDPSMKRALQVFLFFFLTHVLFGRCKAAVSPLLIRRSAANGSISGPTGGSSGATWPCLELFQNGPSLYYTSKHLITTEWLSFAFFSRLSSSKWGKGGLRCRQLESILPVWNTARWYWVLPLSILCIAAFLCELLLLFRFDGPLYLDSTLQIHSAIVWSSSRTLSFHTGVHI